MTTGIRTQDIDLARLSLRTIGGHGSHGLVICLGALGPPHLIKPLGLNRSLCILPLNA
jgi:hypothetical protein